jgi:DNA-directed RNA polymerase subunit RPC12/RpoP
MPYSSRTLEEMLPFICERCGFSFSRNLDEYFKLRGLKCPRCDLRMELNDEEIREVVEMIEACHQAEDLSRGEDEDGGDDAD